MATCGDNFINRFDTSAVTGISGQVAALRPAPIAVHHNGKVFGEPIFVELTEQRLIQSVASFQGQLRVWWCG
jgi:hypothetical protein